MSWKLSSASQSLRRGSPRRKSAAKAGFTLVELLAVVALMVLMMAFIGPAVSSIKGGRDIVSNAYGIGGALDQARSYAMANNTYTWVGFFEEDGAKPSVSGSAPAAVGRVVVGIFASKDGTRYTSKTSTTLTTPSPGNIAVVGKVQKFDGTHLVSSDLGNLGPLAGSTNQIAALTSPGPTVKYPLTAATPNYVFQKIIEFNPQGEASPVGHSLDTAPKQWLGIGLQPARGNVIDPKYTDKTAAAVLIEGLTGRVHIFKQ